MGTPAAVQAAACGDLSALPLEAASAAELTAWAAAAAAGGYVALLTVLLERGAQATRCGGGGALSPLLAAAQAASPLALDLLIARAGDDAAAAVSLHDPHSGVTALALAAAGGRDATVRTLLGANALPSAADHEGLAPLHRAAAGGHNGCAALLLEAKAEVGARAATGETPSSSPA